jgi:hypothetical protein
MAQAQGITHLEPLREQTSNLETEPRLSVDFLNWNLHALETLDEIFGPGSSAFAAQHSDWRWTQD